MCLLESCDHATHMRTWQDRAKQAPNRLKRRNLTPQAREAVATLILFLPFYKLQNCVDEKHI